MIKVNLLKMQAGAVSFGDTEMMGMEPGLTKEERAASIRNVFLIFAPVIGLFMYESYNVDILVTKRVQVMNRLGNIESELGKVVKQLEDFKDVEENAKVLEDKINILRSLSRIRLREVKALDFLQSITPSGIWFLSIDYTNLSFSFKGNSMTDADLTKFVKQLEGSPYFTEVILLKATELKDKTRGTVKNFEISAKSGSFE